MKLAAIDIGSNAARMQISLVLHDENRVSFKQVEYIRFPLQLGKDVFHSGLIGPQREANLTKFIHACKLLFELHEVDQFRLCATSAMREAENGPDIVKRIQEKLNMRIQVITGNQEAELVNNVVVRELDTATYVHIDVGGGSTELNVYVNQKKIAAKSFKIGSVRLLEEPKNAARQWKSMKEWLEEELTGLSEPIYAVGTGGNISKIYEMAKLYQFTQQSVSGMISREDIATIQDFVKRYSVEDRINKLRLNPDRADVIVPAAEIYLYVMQCANAELIKVPEIGLIDGIIQGLYEKVKKVRA